MGSKGNLKSILKKPNIVLISEECDYATTVNLYECIKPPESISSISNISTNTSNSSPSFEQSIKTVIDDFPEPALRRSKFRILSRPSRKSSLPKKYDEKTISFKYEEEPIMDVQNKSPIIQKSKPKKQSSKEIDNISFNRIPITKSILQRPSSVQERRHISKSRIKTEKVSAMFHLFILIFSIIVISMMATLTRDWSKERRRCPLYVKSSPSTDVYWGNEKMIFCNYTSYMPIMIMLISLSILCLNGGILTSYRQGNDVSKLLMSTCYPKTMFLFQVFGASIALSVAIMLTDGLRQTCLTFILNPWPENIPDNCKEGYDERDYAYRISKTYSRILASIVFSWLITIMLLFLSVMYFSKCRFGKKIRN